jgi:hypothetical protein
MGKKSIFGISAFFVVLYLLTGIVVETNFVARSHDVNMFIPTASSELNTQMEDHFFARKGKRKPKKSSSGCGC